MIKVYLTIIALAMGFNVKLLAENPDLSNTSVDQFIEEAALIPAGEFNNKAYYRRMRRSSFWEFDGYMGGRFGGEHSEFSKMGPGGHFNGGITFWFNKKIGLRGDASADFFKARRIENDFTDRSLLLRSTIQAVFNLSEIFGKHTHKFELIFHTGIGGASSFNPDFKRKFDGEFTDKLIKGNDDMIAVVAGLTPKIKVNKRVSVNFDMSFVVLPMQNNYFDRTYDNTYFNKTGFLVNTSMGLSYRLVN
jgi:hypothetical protein